jgi:hypothetical protein
MNCVFHRLTAFHTFMITHKTSIMEPHNQHKTPDPKSVRGFVMLLIQDHS